MRTEDRGPEAVRPLPAHALSPQDRAQVLRVASELRFAATPPARIVPMLADDGVYQVSESTFACVLRKHRQNTLVDAPLRNKPHERRPSMWRSGT